MSSFGTRLKELCIKQGYTQKELADMLGKTKNVVSNWEQGINKPDIDTLILLCKILNVNSDTLLKIDEEKVQMPDKGKEKFKNTFNISNRLKELRVSLGYSVEEFAKKLNVHRSSIYRYEGKNSKETRTIPVNLLLKIHDQFNVNIEWLLGISDIKQYSQQFYEIIPIFESLSDEAKNEIVNFTLYMKSKQK